MKSDNAIWNGTSIFVGIIVAIAAFVRGALLLPLLLVACSIWELYVLHHLRSSLPAVPKKKAKAPRRTKFVVPDIFQLFKVFPCDFCIRLVTFYCATPKRYFF